ncbi:hypothetical protein [Plantactinospora sonchi]|uniref:Uncharacterized protein n=1 Tax=Plantactinospora sonchi TaxID=1544735 RepID=A0ABU7RMW6_9ACTN
MTGPDVPGGREHLPRRPNWRCRVCGTDWPCLAARSLLPLEYLRDRVGLSVYLATMLQEAMTDLHRLNPELGPDPARMYARFLGWAAPRRNPDPADDGATRGYRTSMENPDPHSAEPTDAEPQQFMPLPRDTGVDHAALTRSMAELVELLGGEPLPDSATSKEWRIRAWQTLRASAGEPPQEEWFVPLVRAGVYEPDPSFNARFIGPAVAWFGSPRVQTVLLGYLRTGTNQERAGAARAWYWSERADHRYVGPYTPTQDAEDEDASEKRRWEWQETALREFVANDNLGVRVCILPGLVLNPAKHRPELRDLVAEAVHIARTSPNAYLRHRVGAQLT